MSDDFYDDIAVEADQYFKFEADGDTIEGVIVGMRKHTFKEEEGPVPKYSLESPNHDGPIEITCGARSLKSQMATLKPRMGDWIKVTQTETKGQSKIFTVEHKPAGEAAASSGNPLDD